MSYSSTCGISKFFIPLGFLVVFGVGWFGYSSLHEDIKNLKNTLSPQKGFTEEQKFIIDGVVKDSLKKNPEVIIESVNMAIQNQQVKMRESIEANALKFKTDLFKGITFGNPKAEVHVAVVLDPLCPHCLEFQNILHVLLEKRKDFAVHLTYVGLLGPNSVALAKTYLAASKQSVSKLEDLTFKIASSKDKDQLSRPKLLTLAAECGLDVKVLETAEVSKETASLLETNGKLAESLRLPGVPFILGFFAKGEDATIIPPLDLEGFNKVLDQLKLDKASVVKASMATPAPKSAGS